MKEYRLTYLPAAIKDLDNIEHYIAAKLTMPETATNTILNLLERIEILKTSPQIGVNINEKIDNLTLSEETRMLIIDHYIVLYSFKNKIVTVTKILFKGQDYTNLF